MLISTVLHLGKLSKAIENETKLLEKVQANSASLSKKLEDRRIKKENQKIDLAKALSLYIIWRSIRKDYKESGNKGLKQYQASAMNVLGKKARNTIIRQEILK